MYTANTMASAIEALGLSLPDSSAQEAVSENKRRDSYDAGAAVVNLLERGIKPSDILSREAFENAITTVIALEGSTNAVLHLLAIAHAARIPLTLDDFTRIGKRVPVLADMRPAGRYSMSELIEIGGIRPLMKTLLDAGLLHGGCMTVTGRTLADNLAKVQPYPAGPGNRPAAVESDQTRQPPRRVVRQPRAGRRRCEDHRPRRAAVLRHRAHVPRRRSRHAGDHRRHGRQRRRGRDPVRRSERRPRHARDAVADQRDRRPRPGRRRRADHRWSLLRWLARLRDRARHTGSISSAGRSR